MTSRKKISVFMPYYMKKFHCIGPACEETCCQLWTISVDAGVLDKYRKLEKSELRTLLEKSIEEQASAQSSDYPGKIILCKDGTCPLLDDVKLCRIHATLGEEYLPVVCAMYPRITNKLATTLERSAFMSCPEAARIALLDPDPMEFYHCTEDFVNRDIIKYSMHEDTLEQLATLRQFIFPLLQNRTFKIWERLILLGLFCRKISQNEQSTQEIVAEYEKMTHDQGIKSELDNIPVNLSLQIRLFQI